MRKLFWILIAMLAFVACNDDSDDTTKGAVRATASVLTIDKHPSYVAPDINIPTIGVTIGGKNFTEYSWVEGDIFAVTSIGGVGKYYPEKMMAMNSGSKDVHYSGNFSAVQEIDSYYAVYPFNRTLVGGIKKGEYAGTFWVNYTEQNGSESPALLAAYMSSAKINELNFQFYPVNALLRVELTNAPKTLTKAVLKQNNGEAFITEFQWDAGAEWMLGYSKATSITVHSPSSYAFYIALPPNITLDPFTISIYSEQGLVMEKEYSKRTFEQGYTYLTTIDCQQPEPPAVECNVMTSYDYYAAGDSAEANQMVNTAFILHQHGSYENGKLTKPAVESRYYNVKDDQISSAGVILKNLNSKKEVDCKLAFADGIIGGGSEVKIGYRDIEWGKYTAQAYIILKNGTRITSDETTHYVTGFPYDSYAGEYHGFYSEDSRDLGNNYESLKFPWEDISNGIVDEINSMVFFRGHEHLHMESGSRWAQVLSPKFCIPEKGLDMTAYWDVSCAWNAREATTALLTSTENGGDGSEVLQFDEGDYTHHSMTSSVFHMTPNHPCFQIELQTAFRGPWVRIHRLILEYK